MAEPPRKSVLILKGDIPLMVVLQFLERLSIQVRKRIQDSEGEVQCRPLEPWQLFRRIVGSGNLGACALLLAFRIKLAQCQKLAMHFERKKDALAQNGTFVKMSAFFLVRDLMMHICEAAVEESSLDPSDPIGGFAWIPGVGNRPRYFLATYEHKLVENVALRPHQKVEEAWKVGRLADNDKPLYNLVDGLCLPLLDGKLKLCVCLRGPSYKATWLDGEAAVLSDLEEEKVMKGRFYEFTYGDNTGNTIWTNETGFERLVESVLKVLQEDTPHMV